MNLVSMCQLLIEEKISEQEYLAAQSLFNQLLEVTDVTWKTDILGARIMALNGDTKGAAKLLTDAVEVGRSNSSLLRFLGIYQFELGLLEASIDTLSRAYASSPGNIQIILDYTGLLIENNQVSEALQVFRRSAIMGRRNTEYLNRWLALENLVGDPQIAINERQMQRI